MSHAHADHLHAPRWQWWLVIIFGALTLISGTVGVAKYELQHDGHAHILSAIYHAAQMLILHTPHFEKGVNPWIEAGRWFGVVTLFGATLTLLWARLCREIMLFRINAWSDHYVICGLGRKGFELARCIKARRSEVRVVVIDPHPESDFVSKCQQEGICVIAADASKSDVLARARVNTAKEIIVITPSDETNLRIAAEITARGSEASNQNRKCHVHLSDIHLRDSLQQLRETANKTHAGRRLHFFDVFDHEARRILLELPIDADGICPDDPRSVHVAILGFGRMGRSLALRAAKIGHFANGKPLRVSIIDRDAMAQRERFFFRYPIFAKNEVCIMDFHTAEAESLTTRHLIEEWASSPNTLLHVFVCLSEDARTLEVALRLQSILQGRPSNLLLRIHTHDSLARILDGASSQTPRLIPFGMIEDTCSAETFRREYNEALGRSIHEQFVLARMADSKRQSETDLALRSWEDLREDIRESNRQQADHIAIKLRAIGCDLAEPSGADERVTRILPAEIELLARMEHARWNAERWIAGWRYGTPSDKNKRISENLAPWEDIHESIREYDRHTVQRLPDLLKHAQPALTIVRKPSV